jgi:hypothetical protein
MWKFENIAEFDLKLKLGVMLAAGLSFALGAWVF